eukprot:5327907-Prymnesium_polylepis.1
MPPREPRTSTPAACVRPPRARRSVQETDAIFTQVDKARSARMGVAEMLVGLAAIARKLYPHADTPSSAFYALVSDRLLAGSRRGWAKSDN